MFVRGGTCTRGCGECCTSIRLQVPPAYERTPDIKHWIELHGLKVVRIGEAAFVVIPNRCSALTADNLCSLYGSADRPRLCDAFPATPAAITGLEDVCTYEFRQVEEVQNGKPQAAALAAG